MLKAFRRAAALVAGICMAILLGQSTSVAAHTGFESSDPADGAVVEGPLDFVTIVFTGDAEPTGTGFEVLDASGEIRQPDDASSDDGRTWQLRFDPPLEPGAVGVRWLVKAPDAHPIDGSFQFEVVAPAPPSTATTLSPATTQSPTTTAAASDESPAEPGDDGSVALEDFLAAADDDGSPGPGRLAGVSRLVTLSGTLLAVGGLVFARQVARGDQSDVDRVLGWVRWAGGLVLIGALGELVAQIAIDAGGDWSVVGRASPLVETLSSSFGVALGLRVLGGLGVVVLGRVLAAAPVAASALVGAHLFDGHTVVEGQRLITAAVDIVHVVAGAVWAGGVASLAIVLWRRHRAGASSRAHELALRFSTVASLALAAAGLAGAALTVIVLDRPSDLWSTDWGRVLIVKIGLVGVALALGAVNHYRLLPALDDAPASPDLRRRLRVAVSVETAVFAAVVAATAILMGAAS